MIGESFFANRQSAIYCRMGQISRPWIRLGQWSQTTVGISQHADRSFENCLSSVRAAEVSSIQEFSIEDYLRFIARSRALF